MDYFNYNKAKIDTELENSSGKTNKEYDVVSNSDSSDIPEKEFLSTILNTDISEININKIDDPISPILKEPPSVPEFDEGEIEYDDETDSVDTDLVKSITHEETIDTLTKEIEVWKLKYQIMSVQMDYYKKEAQVLNIISANYENVDRSFFINSEFYNNYLADIPVRDYKEINTYFKFGMLGGCFISTYASILLYGFLR